MDTDTQFQMQKEEGCTMGKLLNITYMLFLYVYISPS